MENLAARIILLSGVLRLLVAALAGALFALAMPPYNIPAVGFISFPVLVWLLDGAATRQHAGKTRRSGAGFRIGWSFGFGYFLAGLWWIGVALLSEGDTYLWALPLAVLGIPAGLAMFTGVSTALARLWWPDGLGRILILAACLGIGEYCRGILLTGFPWNQFGYAAMPIPVAMQTASLIGVDGVTVLAVLVFAVPALFGTRLHRWFGAVLALLLVAAHLGFGVYALGQPLAAQQTVNVRIVQPSISQPEKWDVSQRDAVFAKLIGLTAAPGEDGFVPQLIVWPETALPYLLSERPDALQTIAGALQPGQLLLTGAVRNEGPADDPATLFYNSILVIDDSGEVISAADKLHLVPFGEYLPFKGLLEQFGIAPVAAGALPFIPGQQRAYLELPGGITLLPLICYEVIFSHEVNQRGPVLPQLLVNVTNDAWYGDTAGPYQHVMQARIRAVEQGRPMIRAANNGVSAVFDSRGRNLGAFALDATGNLDVKLPVATTQTPFQTYGTTGFLAILIVFFTTSAIISVLTFIFRR
jgi:apolipoprotein N-acyltransferase